MTPLICRMCESQVDVRLEDSRTAYHYVGAYDAEENPNKPVPLCRECAEIHHAYWDGLWAEYYNSRG